MSSCCVAATAVYSAVLLQLLFLPAVLQQLLFILAVLLQLLFLPAVLQQLLFILAVLLQLLFLPAVLWQQLEAVVQQEVQLLPFISAVRATHVGQGHTQHLPITSAVAHGGKVIRGHRATCIKRRGTCASLVLRNTQAGMVFGGQCATRDLALALQPFTQVRGIRGH